jgi:hypothetical protein
MFREIENHTMCPEEFFKIHRPAVDHDGVICDTRQHVLNFVNNALGTKYANRDIRHWHSVRDWATQSGMSMVDAEDLEEYVWFNPDFLRQAKPIPGAIEMCRWLTDHGIHLRVITSRRPNLLESTIDWYREHVSNLKLGNIHLQTTGEMEGSIFKAFMISRLGADVYFEDVPQHALDILNYTNASVVLLSNLSSPHSYKDSGRIYRISGEQGLVPNLSSFNSQVLKI